MNEQDRSDHATNVTETDGNITAVGYIVDRLTTLFFKMKDAGRPQDKNTIADAIQEIEKLLEQSNGWQATAAGLSQDISNAEDDIERLQEQVRSQALELLIAHSELLGLYDDELAIANKTTLAEMKRLQEQVKHAHAILGNEAMIWLIGGSEHSQIWISTLSPSIHYYWNEYGTVFRQPNVNQTATPMNDNVDQHTPDETVPIEQQHGDYVEEDAETRPRHAHTKWETVKNNRATPSDIRKLPK